MSDGVIVQCARVDRLASTVDKTTSGVCVRCRQRVWLCKPAAELAQSEGIKPLCDICQPAIDIGPLGNIHGDG